MPKTQKASQLQKIIPYQLRRITRNLNAIEEDTSGETHDQLHSANSNNLMMPNSNDLLGSTGLSQVDIFNSLRIPDAIKDLPKFDGNSRLLHEFINNVEEILLYIRGTDNTPYGQILLRAIRNKIEGQANEILNMYGTPLVWDEIKKNLILHYSDKRTETSLIRDLHNAMQFNKTVENFYSEIVELQSALCNNVLLQEQDPNVVKAKKDLYADMCLNSFLSGLKEPLGSRIRTMQPNSLATALAFCIKEQNISYQRSNYRQPKPYYQNSFSRNNTQNRTQNRNHPYQQQSYTNNRNSDNTHQRNQTSTPNTGTNNNNTNKESVNNKTNSAEISRTQQTKLPFKTKQSTQTKYSRSGNFNFHETDNYPGSLDRYFESDINNYTNIDDQQNFQNAASEIQQDT